MKGMSHRSPRKWRYSLIIIVLGILLLEGALHPIYFIKHLRDRKMPDEFYLSPYRGQKWAEGYFKEFAVAGGTMNYEPYYEWRRKEFEGRYINISSCGVRKTWNPPLQGRDNIKTVFCFGGSAMWGTGVRDDFTVASLLSKKLNSGGETNFHVTNYGESAYTLTQEIVYLTLLLKRGKTPDYVIFYDGVNDIYSAYQNGRPGLTQNLEKTRERLQDNPSSLSLIKRGIMGIIRERSMIYRASMRLRAIINKGKGIEGVTASDYGEEELRSLSEDIVSDYIKNTKLIDALSKAYGFQYILAWQPIFYVSTNLTPEEEEYGDWHDEQRIELFRLTYGMMGDKDMEHFHNLSRIFDSKDKTLFVDFCHLCEEGNDIIADKILYLFREELGLDKI